MKKRTRIFWQIYPAIITIALSALVVISVQFYLMFSSSHKAQEYKLAYKQLNQFQLALELAHSRKPLQLDDIPQLLKEHQALLAPFQVDAYSWQGRLLLSSYRGEGKVKKDGSLLPEFLEATQKMGFIQTERFSRRDSRKYVFYALPILLGGEPVAVVRLFRLSGKHTPRFSDSYGGLVAIFLGIIAFLAFISWWVSRGLSRPIEQMRALADRVAKGDFSQKINAYSMQSSELYTLAKTLNRMSEQLKKRLEQIFNEKIQKEITLSNLSEGIISVSRTGLVLELNHAAQKLLGYELAPNYQGQALQKIVRVPELEKFLLSTLKSQKSQKIEARILIGDSYRDLELRSRPLIDKNDLRIGAILLITDVTRTNKLETLRTDFVANVSHELKTPLTSISGFAQTLITHWGSTDDGEKRKFVERIYKNASGLGEMVDDLLALSKVENASDIDEKDPEMVEVKQWVAQVIDTFKEAAAEKQIELLPLEISDDLTVHGFLGLLKQALGNLVQNGIRYTPSGGQVQVGARAIKKGSRVELFVKDNGVGIEMAHQQRLFERFYRIDPARNKKDGGSGLGLALVKHIALLHGGVVRVESQLGQGSTFYLEIPVDMQ